MMSHPITLTTFEPLDHMSESKKSDSKKKVRQLLLDWMRHDSDQTPSLDETVNRAHEMMVEREVRHEDAVFPVVDAVESTYAQPMKPLVDGKALMFYLDRCEQEGQEEAKDKLDDYWDSIDWDRRWEQQNG